MVIGDWMGDAVRTGPRADWSTAGNVAKFAAGAGGETKIDAGAGSSEGFNDDGAGFIVGTSDAAGGAGESDVGERRVALQGCEGLLQQLRGLSARRRSGLLNGGRNDKQSAKSKRKQKASKSHVTSEW